MSALLVGLAIVGPLVAMIAAIAAWFRLRRSLAETTKRLEAYLPAGVAQTALSRRSTRPMAKYHSAVTVAVMRIRNFENLTMNLSPQHTLQYINECLLLCGTAVHRNGGVIERFLEDGLVAVFGIEGGSAESHEYRGARAALEASRMVAAMKVRWELKGRRPYRIGVGVHTGEIIAGDVGFQDQRSFALVGATALFARQLQRLSEELNASVLLSTATYRNVEARFSTTLVKDLPANQLYQNHDVYLVRGLGSGEITEELILPPLTSIPTLLMSDVQDAEYKEILDDEERWEGFAPPAALPARREFFLDEKPIIPDLLRFD
jgi:class 3 adenylate cyclase